MTPEPELKLPDLCQGLLGPQELSELVSDLCALTEIHEVLLKGSSMSMAERAVVDLRTAVALLCDGQVRGVQVRYSWQGAQWMDTLLESPQGVRLVRMPAPL